ncbi:MAG: hypothetical protein AB4042_12835 [Leptolyngbyaceae cyanobacterium]
MPIDYSVLLLDKSKSRSVPRLCHIAIALITGSAIAPLSIGSMIEGDRPLPHIKAIAPSPPPQMLDADPSGFGFRIEM